MLFSKLLYNRILLFSLVLLFLFSCSRPNESHYQFWKDYDSMQRAIKSSTTNETFLTAQFGGFSQGKEKDLKKTNSGIFYLELGGKLSDSDKWSIDWYPETTNGSDYFAKTEYTPKLWGQKEIYTVQRSQTSHWNGYLPRDFFAWLNEFAFIASDEPSYQKLKKDSANLQFLCETMQCHIYDETDWVVLEFVLNEETQKRFPGFYNRTGSRLEKSKLNLEIWDKANPEDRIHLSNQGKTLQFRLPAQPRKQFFQKPIEIHFLADIEIRSYGTIAKIQNLEYVLQYYSLANEDRLKGKFIKVGKKEISGNVLYFIPTGIIDFFIPGNMNEYFSDMLTLLVNGTQGKGGSQLEAVYQKKVNLQTNKITTYGEIMRKKFSLFGNDNSQDAAQDFDFYASWESAMLKDLKGATSH
ncbi:LIC10025 family lipoprotein [Leptospira ilyithenensis]|uniref:Lipoprotein n=1 Tax=Leptospira ilyithenensis TaxID=2484901 RepID=A0A4R9LR75_9LEPT|nr:hypothetical protein [Leptospira ilyithenensis]TGN11003.1 hypothetical protein EHS11_07470 [Leptospira ilyithenensis]